MKGPFEILWAAAAEMDLLRIAEYIAQDDPLIALDVLKKIETAASKLDRTPRRGRVVPELARHGITRYREIVIPPWRLLYRVEEQTVYIVSIIDGRRNVEDILLERLVG